MLSHTIVFRLRCKQLLLLTAFGAFTVDAGTYIGVAASQVNIRTDNG